jgi:hypothetical protein
LFSSSFLYRNSEYCIMSMSFEYRRETPYELSLSYGFYGIHSHVFFIYIYIYYCSSTKYDLLKVKGFRDTTTRLPPRHQDVDVKRHTSSFLINHEMLKPNKIILEIKSYKVLISYHSIIPILNTSQSTVVFNKDTHHIISFCQRKKSRKVRD